MLKTRHLLAALALACASAANASIIADPARVAADKQFVDFDGIGDVLVTPLADFSINTPLITFSADRDFTVGQTGPVDLGINGIWGNGASFLSFDHFGTMAMTVSFGGKTTRSFGADWSLFESDGDERTLTVQAFNRNGKLLESFSTARDGVDLDDGSLAGRTNSSFFQGIRRKDADIAFITISGDRIVMDNFMYTMPVPEPTSGMLMLAGLGVIGSLVRRRVRR